MTVDVERIGQSRLKSAIKDWYDFDIDAIVKTGLPSRSVITRHGDTKSIIRFDTCKPGAAEKIEFERTFSNAHAKELGWPSVLQSRNGRFCEIAEFDAKRYVVSIQDFVPGCHHVKSAEDLDVFAEHLARMYALRDTLCFEQPIVDALDLNVIRTHAVPLILDYCEDPAWSAAVIDDLMDYCEEMIAPLGQELSHGDSHQLNFIIRPNATGAMIDTEYVCFAPRGYDLATAVLDLSASRVFEDVLYFCRSFARTFVLEAEARRAIAALMIFRLLWWLGLRTSWAPGEPLGPASIVERCLEFSLNARLHERRIADALAAAEGPR